MITVFADQESPRLTYILHYIFEHTLKVEYKLILNEEKLVNRSGVIISYSQKKLSNFHIEPSFLLFETGVRRLDLVLDKEDNIPRLLFPAEGENKTSFDPFAAIFFLISRYEEYVHPKTDHHGRILPETTWIIQNGLEKYPIVDAWVNELVDQLNSTFGVSLQKPGFTSLSTIDMDNGYKYWGKGWKRTLGACVKDVKARDFKTLVQRVKTVTGLRKDDYDIYNWLIDYHQEKKLPLTFFVLNARRGSHDHGLPRNSAPLRKLVQKFVKEKIPFGLHPSYHSNRKKVTLRHELEGLRDMADSIPVKMSRQHYLRFRMPLTFENLIELGIEHDYSMGFASIYGFRAGTCRSFPFFNLSTNTKGDLTMHPVTVMEGTFKDYMKLHSSEAIPHIAEMIKTVKKFGGEFISIWHEAQLAERSSWRKVYLEMNDIILEVQA